MDAQQPSPSPHERLPSVVSPAQVIALGLVAVSIGWAVWLLRDQPTTEEVELLAGMQLPSSEMAIMEAAFDRAQLADHRTDGGRVWVPRSRQSAYMRALVDAEALPREFGGSLRRALEKNSPWQSRAVQDELLRVATQEELSLVICSMPGIERAAVLYDNESHHALDGSGPAKTASVNVRTQPDMELDPARVQAIRVLVGASIAGLSPEKVAVTDLRSGRVYVGPLDADAERQATATAVADPALARTIAHEQYLATKVRQSLGFLKGATVDVSIDFGTAGSDPRPLPPRPEDLHAAAPAELPAAPSAPLQKPADANAPAEIRPRLPMAAAAVPEPPRPAPEGGEGRGDMPASILVSIAVPDTYFQSVCRAAAERAGQPALQPIAIEAQEIDRIRRHVQNLLPATRDPAGRRVTVTSFPALSPPQGRRDQAGRTASAEAGLVVAGGGRSIDAVGANRPASGTDRSLAAISAALLAGRFADVPRQAWLAATSVCVGIIAGFLWWAGGRRQTGLRSRSSEGGFAAPRIDWSDVGGSEWSEPPATGSGADRAGRGVAVGRAAAAIVLLCLATDPAAAAGPEPAAAVVRLNAGRTPDVLPAVPLTDRDGLAPAELATDKLAIGSRGSVGRGGPLANWGLLAAIAAAFAVVAAATRFTKRHAATLPPDVFEVLGEGSLGGQHGVRIVRFGPKTLLVAVSAAGSQTLAELSDPQATACIAAACRGSHPPLRPRSGPRPVGPTAHPVEPVAPTRVGGEAA